jgi:DNA-binding transcriptional ArsR family regulator
MQKQLAKACLQSYLARVEPEREILDLDALRLLAHPLRRRIEKELRRGPVTATSLAKALGESTGLTSYHLRELARHGFVEEVPELRRGRERWWRIAPKDRRFPPLGEQSSEVRAVLVDLQRRQFIDDFERSLQGVEESDGTGGRSDAYLFSTATIDVDVEGLREFFEKYIALLHQYKGQPKPGARTVQVRLFTDPDPDRPQKD